MSSWKNIVSAIFVLNTCCYDYSFAADRTIYLDNGIVNWQSPVGKIDRLLLVASSLKLNMVTSINLTDEIGVLAIAIDHVDAECNSLIDISGPAPKKFLFQINSFSGCENSGIIINLPSGKRGRGVYVATRGPFASKLGPCESQIYSARDAKSAMPGQPGVFSRICSPDVNFGNRVIKIKNPGGVAGDRGLAAVNLWINSLNGKDEYLEGRGELPGEVGGVLSELYYLRPLKEAIESQACSDYYSFSKFTPVDGERLFQDFSTCLNQDPDDFYWMASLWYFKLLSQASFNTVQAISAGEQEKAYHISKAAAALLPTVPLTSSDQLAATKIISDAVTLRAALGAPVAYQLPTRRISPLDSRPLVVLDVRSLETFLLPTAILPRQIDSSGRLAALVLSSDKVELNLDGSLENFPIEMEQAALTANTTSQLAARDPRWMLDSITSPDATVEFSQFGIGSISMKIVVNKAYIAKVMANLVSANGMPFQLNWSYNNGGVSKKFISIAYLSFQNILNPSISIVDGILHNDAKYSIYINNGILASGKIVFLGCTIASGGAVGLATCAPDLSEPIVAVPPMEVAAVRNNPEVLGQYMISPITDGQIVDYSISCQLTTFNSFFNAQLVKASLMVEVKDQYRSLGLFPVSRESCEQLRSYKFSVLLIDPASIAKLVVSGEFSYLDGSRRIFEKQESTSSYISISDSDLK